MCVLILHANLQQIKRGVWKRKRNLNPPATKEAWAYHISSQARLHRPRGKIRDQPAVCVNTPISVCVITPPWA